MFIVSCIPARTTLFTHKSYIRSVFVFPLFTYPNFLCKHPAMNKDKGTPALTRPVKSCSSVLVCISFSTAIAVSASHEMFL